MHLYRAAQGLGEFRGPIRISQFFREWANDDHFLEDVVFTSDVEKGGIDRVTEDALEIFRIAVVGVAPGFVQGDPYQSLGDRVNIQQGRVFRGSEFPCVSRFPRSRPPANDESGVHLLFFDQGWI